MSETPVLKRVTQSPNEAGPVGLDDRPRPASARARIVKGLKQSAPFSSLQRRIIFFNLVGLAMLVAGMTYLSNEKRNLIDVYIEALRKQGEIVAIGIAETAAVDSAGRPSFDPAKSATVLARLSEPTGVRMRLYDNGQRLTADTYSLSESGAPIEVFQLGPPATHPDSGLMERFEGLYERLNSYFGSEETDTYYEVSKPGVSSDSEVMLAAQGQIANSVRVNSQGEVVVSVAIPVTQLKVILGVLQLSTVGGDIERFVSEEKKAVLEIFFLAAIVSVLLSILLANMIASPIRDLAKAAHSEGANAARPISPEKPEIPDLTHRTDEIGELSGALIRMTGALYARIGAIESFASDVAHEIKNPLTSLRSAVETMHYAKTPEQRQRLLDVIQNDVKRMDRLVTDISNASRLDAELVRERMEPFNLGDLIQMLCGVTEAQGSDLNVTVDLDLPDGGLVAHGLEGRIAQVVTNLLGNALSFSPQDGTIRVVGRKQRNGAVTVTVEDDGPGIPPDNLSSIFERFYSERPDSEAFGNHSGLGLSISRQIIQAHDGKIWAENIQDPDHPDDVDKRLGARFTFTLPK
ncbi:MAG: stimulus-sensing domain-containing protein [Pseudomonadota bacterium]